VKLARPYAEASLPVCKALQVPPRDCKLGLWRRRGFPAASL